MPSRATWARLTLLGSLYFAQGLPYGFFYQAVPVLLRQQGMSLGRIGFTTLLTLPWALKFLWAPLVDRWYWPRLGQRRSWILPMQAASAAALLVMAALPDSADLAPLLIGFALLNLFAATQDIATDGFAVELLPPSERGLANGLQVAGYRAGMVVGGGGLLAAYDDWGKGGVFAAMAAMIAVASVPVWLTRETSGAPVAQQPASSDAHFLRSPGVAPILALLFLYKLGTSLATGMLRPFLTDLGLTTDDVAKVVGTVGFLAGLAGALVGGALVGVLGRRRALILFGLAQAASVAGYFWLALAPPSRASIYWACGGEHFASGLGTAALFTAMMDWARPRQAGTDYTVQASAVVIATGIATAVSGVVAEAVGYRGLFALAIAACLAGTLAAAVLFPRRAVHAAHARP